LLQLKTIYMALDGRFVQSREQKFHHKILNYDY